MKVNYFCCFDVYFMISDSKKSTFINIFLQIKHDQKRSFQEIILSVNYNHYSSLMILIFIGFLAQSVLLQCIPPSFTLLQNPPISLSAPSNAELQQSLYQFVTTQPDPSSASGFIRATLPYLIPLLIISASAIGVIIFIIWKRIKDKTKIEIEENHSQKVCYYIGIVLILIIGLGLVAAGILNILATFASSKQLEYLNCISNQRMNGFFSGSGDSWMGVNNLPTNVSQVRVSFVNNIRQLNNGLKGFTLNGTASPYIGYPVSGFGSMQNYVRTNINPVLSMNNSASTIKVPICRTIPFTVADPIDNANQVSFPMMTEICNAITKQKDALIQNAKSMDSLLSNYTTLVSNVGAINTSLTGVESSLTSLQSNLLSYKSNNLQVPYISQFSSHLVLSYLISGLSIIIGMFSMVLVYFILVKQNQQVISVISLTLNIVLLVTIIITSVVCMYYLVQSVVFKYLCTLYQRLPSSDLYSKFINIFSLSQTVFTPLYTCITNSNSKFLTTNTSTFQNLKNLNQLFVNGTPPFILESVAVNYTNLTTQYLGDLSKLKLSNSSINLTQLLNSINSLANYNITNSTQLPCTAAQDQFYYNSLNCTSTILDPAISGETTIRQPRCIQIPSGERQSGSLKTSLNEVQNLYNISTAPCNSMGNTFNNSLCFFQQRINTIFGSSDCISKGTTLSNSIKNLVRFSIEAGDAWDSYLQNLRNYLGALLVFNTNLTTFYANNNVTEMFNSFSAPSNNLLTKTNCGYIYSGVNEMYQTLNNSIDDLLLVVVVTFSITISSFVLMISILEVDKRVIRDNKVGHMKRNDSEHDNNIFNDVVYPNQANLTQEQIHADRLVTEQAILDSPKDSTRKRNRKEEKLGVTKLEKDKKKQQKVAQIGVEKKEEDLKNLQEFPIVPIEPLQFSQEGQKVKDDLQNIPSTQTKQQKPNVTSPPLIRPGEFASSSVKNIRNVILEFDRNHQQQQSGRDNIIIQDLDSNNFRQPRVEQEEKEDQDQQSWVSETLSQPNNK